MRTIRAEHTFDGQSSLPDAATEVVHQDGIVGIERGHRLTRLRT
jgi:hypothetical protein